MSSVILHYDTNQSTKQNNNCFNTKFTLIESLKNIKSISLRSCELSPIINFRFPYNIFYYSITNAALVTTNYTFTMPDKVYTSISSFLYDLNLNIVSQIQPKLQINETAPIFSLNSSDSSRLSISYTYVTSQINFINDGILLYYLGRSFFSNPIITGTTIKTSTTSFLYPYNLNFDTYVNMNITNLFTISKNNSTIPCNYKLLLKTSSTGYSFIDETYLHQYIDVSNQLSLNSLSIYITDRYGNSLFTIHDYSFTLEYFY